jgi:hypothetical protein
MSFSVSPGFPKAVLILCSVSLALVSLPVSAQRSTPTPSPTPTPKPASILGGGFRQAIPTRSKATPTGQTKKLKKSTTPLVISNNNLQELAQQSPDNSFGNRRRRSTSIPRKAGSSDQEPTPEIGSGESKKDYWQRRWRTVKQEIKRLEQQIPRLEAAHNKAATDSIATQGHDRWDAGQAAWAAECARKYEKAKAALDEARQELAAAKEEEQQILNDARRDDAKPGWFR